MLASLVFRHSSVRPPLGRVSLPSDLHVHTLLFPLGVYQSLRRILSLPLLDRQSRSFRGLSELDQWVNYYLALAEWSEVANTGVSMIPKLIPTILWGLVDLLIVVLLYKYSRRFVREKADGRF